MGQTNTYTYDDEDRLTRLAQSPSGIVNTYTYNGLGLRVGLTDSQGTHTYLCDGTSPGSPVLSDGFAVYTPGLSEHRGGSSFYYDNDLLGNLWTVDGTGKSQAFYEDTTGFGAAFAAAGAGTTPFKFGGGNGCQTDGDTSLVLMGYRYYDSRTGRFITQDPAGDGDNWYVYADNSPTNEIDPGGLMSAPVPGNWSVNGGDQTDFASVIGHDEQDAISSFSTYTATVHLFLWRTTDYHNGKGPQLTGLWPLASWMFGGGAIAAGPPESYEPGVGPGGEKGVWKNYKDGQRVFEPDPLPPVKKKGHGDGGRNQGVGGDEHSKNAKGNRTPRSTGGSGIKRFNPLIAGVGAAGAGYLIYQGIKDTIAVLGAPETAGASLLLLAVP